MSKAKHMMVTHGFYISFVSFILKQMKEILNAWLFLLFSGHQHLNKIHRFHV